MAWESWQAWKSYGDSEDAEQIPGSKVGRPKDCGQKGISKYLVKQVWPGLRDGRVTPNTIVFFIRLLSLLFFVIWISTSAQVTFWVVYQLILFSKLFFIVFVILFNGYNTSKYFCTYYFVFFGIFFRFSNVWLLCSRVWMILAGVGYILICHLLFAAERLAVSKEGRTQRRR